MQTNVNVQGLTVEAALTGRREAIYQAAMLDPHTAAELSLDEIALFGGRSPRSPRRLDPAARASSFTDVSTGHAPRGREDRLRPRAAAARPVAAGLADALRARRRLAHAARSRRSSAALGRDEPRVDIGEQVIPLDSIVGTVDRRRGEFDRSFRPSPSTRGRWERIAEARKRGEAMPPIDVFRIGDLLLRPGRPPPRLGRPRAGRQGHQRATSIEVRTKLGADRELQMQRPAAEGARARLPRARAAPAAASASGSSSPTSGATRSSPT